MRVKEILFSNWTRWIVSIVLIAVLLRITDVQQMLDTITSARWVWFAAAIGFAMFLTAFSAIKWWVLMPRTRTSIMSFFRVTFISNFVGIFFPGIVGVEASRIAGIALLSKDMPAAIASVLVDRLFGLFSLGLLVAVGGVLAHEVVPAVVSIGCLALMTAILAGAVLVMSYRFRRGLTLVLPTRMNNAAGRLFECLDLYRDKRAVLVTSLVLSIIFQLFRVVMVYLLAISLSITVDILYLLIVVPAALFVQMVPVSIFGIGIREATVITLLAAEGVSSESAFALSILLAATQIIAYLPGAFMFAAGRRNEAKALS